MNVTVGFEGLREKKLEDMGPMVSSAVQGLIGSSVFAMVWEGPLGVRERMVRGMEVVVERKGRPGNDF